MAREEVAQLPSPPSSVFLFGCSSARLRHYGDFGNQGAIYAWILSGCQHVVGFLYDVTTGDADKLATALLEDTALEIADIRGRAKFPYLNGAALVRYGVPGCR